MAAASGAIFDQIILLPVDKNIFVSICFISLVLKITYSLYHIETLPSLVIIYWYCKLAGYSGY